jgi:phage terminase large subunit-like protein
MSSALLTTEEFHPHIQALFDYADSVITGQKPACLQERQACERFYDDLERESEYRFDHALAIRAINFIELLPHVNPRAVPKVHHRQYLRLDQQADRA